MSKHQKDETEALAAIDVAPRPSLAKITNAYAFNQGVQWAAKVAASAGSLGELQLFLRSVAEDTQALCASIDAAERAVLGRVQAGTPTLPALPGDAK